MTQTASGKAFEFAIAVAMSEITSAPLIKNTALKKAEGYYTTSKKREKLDKAATEAAMFLVRNDAKFKQARSVFIQSDSQGQSGDVRDVIINLEKGDLGISAKNNHTAIKHSRLSDKIDFGEKWGGYAVSPIYFANVTPVFARLRAMRAEDKAMKFDRIPNKDKTIYEPVLTAFENELERLCNNFQGLFISNMFNYLLGKHDFYKVIRQDAKKAVIIESMNINGTLGWGSKWRLPNGIDNIKRKANSANTLIVSFTGGWQLSFRLHNASSRVEPSLKFDIQFIGMSASVSKHEIPLG